MEKLESEYNMIDWWKKCVFKNYANFRGRARRSEFWYFVLFSIILIIPAFVLFSALAGLYENSIFSGVIGLMLLAIFFVLLIPYLAVVVRRLHDQNKSGWNYFIGFIPVVGPIIMLVWYCTEGDRFTNNYGEDPKNNGMLEFDFDKNPA